MTNNQDESYALKKILKKFGEEDLVVIARTTK
jgi:hypothetical protein